MAKNATTAYKDRGFDQSDEIVSTYVLWAPAGGPQCRLEVLEMHERVRPYYVRAYVLGDVTTPSGATGQCWLYKREVAADGETPEEALDRGLDMLAAVIKADI